MHSASMGDKGNPKEDGSEDAAQKLNKDKAFKSIAFLDGLLSVRSGRFNGTWSLHPTEGISCHSAVNKIGDKVLDIRKLKSGEMPVTLSDEALAVGFNNEILLELGKKFQIREIPRNKCFEVQLKLSDLKPILEIIELMERLTKSPYRTVGKFASLASLAEPQNKLMREEMKKLVNTYLAIYSALLPSKLSESLPDKFSTDCRNIIISYLLDLWKVPTQSALTDSGQIKAGQWKNLTYSR